MDGYTSENKTLVPTGRSEWISGGIPSCDRPTDDLEWNQRAREEFREVAYADVQIRVAGVQDARCMRPAVPPAGACSRGVTRRRGRDDLLGQRTAQPARTCL